MKAFQSILLLVVATLVSSRGLLGHRTAMLRQTVVEKLKSKSQLLNSCFGISINEIQSCHTGVVLGDTNEFPLCVGTTYDCAAYTTSMKSDKMSFLKNKLSRKILVGTYESQNTLSFPSIRLEALVLLASRFTNTGSKPIFVELEETKMSLHVSSVKKDLHTKSDASNAVSSLLKNMKAVKDLYFTDAKIQTVQDGFCLELHIQGKVGKPKKCDGPITCALVGLSNMPTLRFVIKVNPKSKSFSTDISFITPTTVLKTDSTWLEDSNGAGPSPFLEFSVDNFVPEISMGVRLGITFCVENCQNEYKKRGSKGEILAIPGIAKSEANYLSNLEDKFLPREISLDGTLAVSVAPNGPPGIGGSLDLVGSWYNVNALPLLHIANARVALDIIPAVPLPIPVGFQLGGEICLGKETLCRIAFGDSEDVASSDKLIKGIAYVGIDKDPDKNYFLAMISETNLFKVLDILGDTVDEGFNQIRDILPAIIGETGVYPMKYDVATKKNPCTAGMLADVSNNMDCYARVSLASEEHNLKNIKIPRYAFIFNYNYL